VLGDEGVVVGDADQRPPVAGEGDDRAGAKDGVDGAATKTAAADRLK
jgi:hypothetical protein